MRILVLGAGAIGSLVGGRLAESGHDVGLVGRAAYAQAVRERGLLLTEGSVTQAITTLRVGEQVGDMVEALGGLDLAILATKVFDTRSACALLAPYLEPSSHLLLLQNGVGGEELAAGVLGTARLISGVVTRVVSVVEPGHYAVMGHKGGIGVAPVEAGSAPYAASLRTWLTRAGFACRQYADYRAMKWSKLLLNMLGNAVPAILGLAPSEVFGDARLYALELAAFREALAVLRGLGLRPAQLPDYPAGTLALLMRALPAAASRPLMARLVAGGREGKKPSLQLDLERGRAHSEVSYLNGAVVYAAEGLGLAAPANRAITETLEGIAAGRIPWADLQHRPEALLARARELGWQS
ncbi:MAG: ketopantoate reductase family protein [Anaerolineae bacterium]